MPRQATIPHLRSIIRERDQLDMRGWSDRAIRVAIKDGELRRLRRGHYIDGDEWGQLWPESQHLAEVVAAASTLSSPHVAVSHESAAVVWGLPLHRLRPTRVRVTVDPAVRITSSVRVTRHTSALPESDVTVHHGIVCTTLDRTVFDVTRTLRPEAAVSCAGAALRQVAVSDHQQDVDLAERWREAMLQRVDAAPGARVIRQARRVLEFADGGAQLPGEGVSRLQLARLGCRRVRTQIPVAAPDGGTYWVDFGIDEAGAFGEFDGKDKYLDEAMLSGRTIEQVMLDEKSREDWIRGTTNRRFARWGSEHIATPEALAARLRAFSIAPPR